jgi:hypothetical protein
MVCCGVAHLWVRCRTLQGFCNGPARDLLTIHLVGCDGQPCRQPCTYRATLRISSLLRWSEMYICCNTVWSRLTSPDCRCAAFGDSASRALYCARSRGWQ